jgi:hypothetical protein
MKQNPMRSRLETDAYEDLQALRLAAWARQLEVSGLEEDLFADEPLDPRTLLLVARGTLDELRCARTSNDRQRLKGELDDLMHVLGRRMVAN